MINRRIFNIIVQQFMQRKLRTALTIIGVMIGIASLVSLVLLSGALKTSVTAEISSLGSDIILLAPKAAVGGGGGPTGVGSITADDVTVIESLPQVKEVISMITMNVPIEYGKESKRLQIQAYEVTDDYETFFSQGLHDGRFLDSQDRASVNIGYKLAHDTFDKEILVGSSLSINGTKFRVVGIFDKAGDQAKDNYIIIPIEELRKSIGDNKAVTAMMIRIQPNEDIALADERITQVLKRYRGEKDFATITPAQLTEQINGLLGVVDIVVISIAAISLFVGALGIMNALYTSVLQRTKEIGTMKAVGARNSQILSIFVVEAAALGLAGGIIGVLFGIALAQGIVSIINLTGLFQMKLDMDPTLFIGAISVAVIVGVIAGFLPALRASRLRPVDALRYE